MKTRLTLGDKIIEAEKMDFKPIDESWSLYRLEDGTIIKLRLIVSEIYKLPGVDPVTRMPLFLAKSSNVMAVDPAASSMTDIKGVN